MSFSTEVYFVTIFFSTILGFFVLMDNPKKSINRYFCLLCFSISLWILSNILVNLNIQFSLQFVRIAIVWVALLPIFFNQLIKSLYFVDNAIYTRINKVVLNISYTITLVIILLSQTKLNIISISFEPWGVGYKPGILYIVLLLYLFIAFGFSFFNLYKISLEIKNPRRDQSKFILIGACTTLILSILTNIVLPFMGHSYYSIFGPSTTIIFLTFIAYSITRHHLFNIRVIAIELVTFGLWITILIRTLLATTLQEQLIEGGLLLVTIIFGVTLIKSTLHVIRQREKIDSLTTDLTKAYDSLDTLNQKYEQEIRKKSEIL